MATVTICSDFGAQENKICHCFHFLSIYLPQTDGTRCHDLSFWMLSFKPDFSLSSFTKIAVELSNYQSDYSSFLPVSATVIFSISVSFVQGFSVSLKFVSYFLSYKTSITWKMIPAKFVLTEVWNEYTMQLQSCLHYYFASNTWFHVRWRATEYTATSSFFLTVR